MLRISGGSIIIILCPCKTSFKYSVLSGDLLCCDDLTGQQRLMKVTQKAASGSMKRHSKHHPKLGLLNPDWAFLSIRFLPFPRQLTYTD